MTPANHQPESLDQICDLIRSNEQVTITGGAPKERPDKKEDQESTTISTKCFQGIVDHQASDFTITALSGTPVSELITVLKQAGQFLPFDPVFTGKGATVGGLVASGLNGPCRLRFGGMRDFVIGCQFVNGQGQAVRAGGRVVKNAAGYDLPKFLIGSGGRFGLLTEVTFKVFPMPNSLVTILYETEGIEAALKLTQRLASSLEFEAIEISQSNQVIARLSGHSDEVCNSQVEQLKRDIPLRFDTLHGKEEMQFWNGLANFNWLDDGDCLVKIPLTIQQIGGFDKAILQGKPKTTRRYSTAGNVALVAINSSGSNLSALNLILEQRDLAGQVITGTSNQYLIGKIPSLPFLHKIKKALDPRNRFGAIDNA